jgi:hypothetical protein
MYTKLTLNIDHEVIENAKTYAKNNKRSVSRLVEEYLASISSNKNTSRKSLGPITKEIAGIIKIEKNIDPGELLADALMEKYL